MLDLEKIEAGMERVSDTGPQLDDILNSAPVVLPITRLVSRLIVGRISPFSLLFLLLVRLEFEIKLEPLLLPSAAAATTAPPLF